MHSSNREIIMIVNQELLPAFIYIPHLKKWAQITGGCLVDGRFQLIFRTEDKENFGTLNPDTVNDLIKSFGVTPF